MGQVEIPTTSDEPSKSWGRMWRSIRKWDPAVRPLPEKMGGNQAGNCWGDIMDIIMIYIMVFDGGQNFPYQKTELGGWYKAL